MKCNTCGSEKCEFLFSNGAHISTRISNPPRDIYICQDCGQVFIDVSTLTESILQEYYSKNNPFEVPGDLIPEHQQLRVDQAKWIIQRIPDIHQNRILDVGCGTGFLLKMYEKYGLIPQGLDFSQRMVENVRNTYKIPCYQGWDDISAQYHFYDIISCITVLEHFLDPASVIKKFHKLLKTDGFVYLEVPDANSPRWDMIPDHLAFEHIHHWTEFTLSTLLQLNNFSILAVEHIVNGPDSGNPEAVMRLLAQKTEKVLGSASLFNDYQKEKEVLIEYRKKHQEYVEKIQSKLKRIEEKIGDRSYAIYCGGQHTASLLETMKLNKNKILCIFDGDPAISGTTLYGIPVVHSSEIAKYDVNHFLLSTTNHERPIYHFLKKLNPDYQVYGIYQDFN